MDPLIIVSCALIGMSAIALWCYTEYSVHRTQVGRLQAQRRLDKKGGIFTPQVEGLWPDIDEVERLKAEVEELRIGRVA